MEAHRPRGPALTLFFLAPLVGEVLFGATPLTRLPTLVGLVAIYGGGALLVRELVRGRGLGLGWLLLGGVAYAVIEEGLVVQSLFNPLFKGLDFLGRYGRAGGVSWVWSVFIVGYHAVFSITLPILLAEVAFADRRREPWLDRRGLVLVAALFVLDCSWLAFGYTGVLRPGYHNPAPAVMIGAALLVAGIVAAIARARPAPRAARPGRAPPSPRRLRLAALGGALAWFAVRMFLTDPHYPVAAPLLGDAAVIALLAALAARWSATGAWTPEHHYALAAGPLPASWLFGFLVVAVSSPIPPVDLVGHALLGVVMLVALRRLHRRVRARGPTARAAVA